MNAADGLEVWRGPARSGRTAAALALYRETLARAPLSPRRRGLWLAPNGAAAAGVREQLLGGPADGAATALLDPGVTTFVELAETVMWAAGRRFRMVTPCQRRHLLRRAIAEAGGTLRFFRRAAESPGLLAQLDQLVAQQQRRGLSAEEFADRVRQAPPRLRDLAALYRQYVGLLERLQALDAEGLLVAARDALRSAPAIGSGLELAVVDGFTDFTLIQQEILGLLAHRARRLVVTLLDDAAEEGPPRAGRDELFALPRATAAALASVARSRSDRSPCGKTSAGDMSNSDAAAGGESTGDARRGMRVATVDDRPASLRRLERNLFRSPRGVEPPSAAVRASLDRLHVIAASSVQGEIDEIARRVKQLLLDGEPPGEIVVAFRSTEEVADRLRRAFDDCGVPAELDVEPPLAATPLVRSFLSLLQLQAEDWPYRRLLQVIGDRSLALGEECEPGELNSGAAALAPRAAAELCVRHAQLPSGREELLELVESWTAGEGAATPVEPEVARSAAAVLSRLAHWLRDVPQRAPLGAWIGAGNRLARSVGLLKPAAASEAGAEATAWPWQATVQALRELAAVERLLGGEPVEYALAEFTELLAAVAAETPVPAAREAAGRVRILSTEAARFIRPRRLFLGGLSEQSFPLGRPAAEAGQEAADGDATAARPAAASGEMLLFYQLVTRPSQSLTLSYPALDAKAQTLPPSPLLLEVERAFADAPLPRTVQPLGYGHEPSGPPLSRRDLRRAAVQQALERKRDLLAALVRSPRYQAVGRSIVAGIEAVADRSERRRFGAHDGVFASDGAKAVLERQFSPGYLWSPSLLETYASCPFQFLARHVWKLAPPPDLALETDLARRGSLLHDTLARLYARLAAGEGTAPPPPAEVAEQFRRTLDALIHARPQRGLARALWEIERRQIASWAERFAEQHAEYTAAWAARGVPLAARHFEARFGPKNRRSESMDDASLSTDQPYELKDSAGGRSFSFTGQIDRIDVGRVGDATVFNVIDYKTSARAKVDPEAIAAGTQLQLPLYALAAAELLLADLQATPLAAGYWSIRGKGFGLGARSGGPLLIGEIRDDRVELSVPWTRLRATLLARIAEIVTGIRGGQFPVFSVDKNCTQYCEFSTVCRIAHVRNLEKTWTPPEPQP